MTNWLNTIGSSFNNRMIIIGRQRARSVLLGQSNRTLQDLGISRTLLESGVQQWPWHANEDQPQPASRKVTSRKDLSRREEAKAIRELRAMSDSQLRDIGVNRGNIVEAVRNGRSGIEAPVTSTQVIAVASTGTSSVGRDELSPIKSAADKTAQQPQHESRNIDNREAA